MVGVTAQGRALDKVAKKDVKVMVVGNPCNTNALIALGNAPSLNARNFHALTRLDEVRACSLQLRCPSLLPVHSRIQRNLACCP